QMVLTAEDLREQQISIPLLVGGAALSRKFAETKIQEQYDGTVFYEKDAMKGLEIANDLYEHGTTAPKREVSEKVINKERAAVKDVTILHRSNVSQQVEVKVPEDLEKHTYLDYKLTHL